LYALRHRWIPQMGFSMLYVEKQWPCCVFYPVFLRMRQEIKVEMGIKRKMGV